MAGKIQVDYDQLTQVSNLFAQEAQSLESWAGRADQGVEALMSGGWAGDAANKFFGEWQMISPNLKKLIDALQTASSQMQTVSQLFTDGENRAAGTVKRTL